MRTRSFPHALSLGSLTLSFLALALGCSSAHDAAAPSVGAAAAAAAPVCAPVTVNTDGSFSPSSLALAEGSCVLFRGPGGAELRTTDAIVRVDQARLDLADISHVSCMTSGAAYDITHMLPGEDNELTGPLRRGTSGVYAVGPEEAEGFYEGPAGDDCAAIGAAAGSAAATSHEHWVETTATGSATKLCRKHKNGNDKPAETNGRFILQSTWDNPDITGGLVRVNWSDLYTMTLVGGVETYTKDYSKLDTELANAAKRGKLVLLEVPAGEAIPPWLFSDYPQAVDATGTGLAPKSVIPIKTKDFGTHSGTEMPTADSCGYEKTMGSPADGAYKTAVLAMLRDVAAHIRSNGNYYQALGSFKVTGLNFLTGEMRLPKRCLDPLKSNEDNGNPQTTCWCNTRIWAAPLGARLPAYVDPDPDDLDHDGVHPETVNGGGYTAAIAQNFMNAVENALYEELGKRKTMHFMLIQDGFPKVVDSAHYAMDSMEGTMGPWYSPWGPSVRGHTIPSVNYGYVDGSGVTVDFDQQTQDALDSGQLGNFKRILADGSPDVAAGGDPDAAALFAVMHAGLTLKPEATCPQQQIQTLVNGTYEALLRAPNTYAGGYGSSTSGCPNKWATREGYEGQISGFQTQNDLVGPDDLSSALWNATINSNAVFFEAYEGVLWRAKQERGTRVLSTTAAGFSADVAHRKSLAQWTAELHKRRRTIAGYAENAENRHMKDPFPTSYEFTFKKNLAPGAVETYRFINPAARCAAGTLASGRITITGL